MIKKIFTFLLAFIVGFQPLVTPAFAGDLGDAFNSLLPPGGAVSLSAPGRYQSGARNTFFGGGLELRVPRAANNPQLFSVTPPRIVAGCNGISATFGGFSFISGRDFELMLKQIASGATLGFVSMLTLKTLCPQCEAVVQFLKTAAQAAAKLSRDSCQLGEQLAQSLFSSNSSNASPNSVNVCGASISDSNGSGDFLKAVNGACKSITDAVDALVKDNPTSPACQSNPNGDACKKEQAELKCRIGSGNVTWQRLSAFDGGGTSLSQAAYERRLLLLNLLGAELKAEETGKQVGCETEGDAKFIDKNKPSDFCVPKLQPADVLALYMCGAPVGGRPPGNPSSRVLDYCGKLYTPQNGSSTSVGSVSELNVYRCLDDERIQCSFLTLRPAGDLFGGEGFLTRISQLLQQGVDAVRTNQPLPQELIRLMQVAPVPLYQAINAAAVYPAAAADLLDSMSILVAEQFAIAMFDELLRMPGRSAAPLCLSQAQAATILEVVGRMRGESRNRLSLLGQNMAAQQLLTEQIRQINLTIQRQVLSQDLLNSGNFAESVNRAVAPQSAGTPPASN